AATRRARPPRADPGHDARRLAASPGTGRVMTTAHGSAAPAGPTDGPGRGASPTPAMDGERRPDLHHRGRKPYRPTMAPTPATEGGRRRHFFKRRRNPYRLTTPARAREGGRRRELRG